MRDTQGPRHGAPVVGLAAQRAPAAALRHENGERQETATAHKRTAMSATQAREASEGDLIREQQQ